MKIQQVKSTLVREIITSSSTPALDILSAMARLEQWEKNEALEYFRALGGLHACATREHNFCVQFDV